MVGGDNMAKYRVWAQSITDVYIDVEADDEEQAREIAEETDGGDFSESPYGEWIIGEVYKL